MSIFNDLGVRDGKDRQGEAALYNLAACYNHAERLIAEHLTPHGLTPVKMNALLIIRHVGGPQGLAQNEIGKRMIVTAGNVTRLLDRLEKERLIERVSQAGDRRVKLVRITAKAATLLDQVWPDYKRMVNALMEPLSGPEMASTVKNLEKLRKSLES